MRSKLLLATFVAALGLAAGWLVGHRPAAQAEPGQPARAEAVPAPEPKPAREPIAIAPDPRPVPKKTYIPLSEIYTTSYQPQLAGMPRVPKDSSPAVNNIKAEVSKSGTSNAFVMSADGNQELVYYTSDVFRNAYPPEVIWRRKVKPGTPLNLWFVVVLPGAHSSPPAWEVVAAESYGSRLRVRYRYDTEAAIGSNDVHPYIYWCKVPETHHREYQLELFDEAKQRVVLSRQVQMQYPLTQDDEPVSKKDDVK